MSAIELQDVVKRFGATTVLNGVELSVPVGSITAVLGASGTGKTTLLRLIAGFEQLDEGTLKIGGRVVDDGSGTVPAQRRGIGYVPQEGALFPHLTVAGNIGFGLPRGSGGRIRELLDLVGLTEIRNRYPHQLSGGQQQRVALARALAVNPAVVLLDEPFSALDASLRSELRQDVTAILAQTGTTTVLVTHDQDEALALADTVVLLVDGRVRAAARPRELYRDPPDEATATSIGAANILRVHVSDGHGECALGSVPIRQSGSVQGESRLLLRPEQLLLRTAPSPHAPRGAVVAVEYHGHDALARVRLLDQECEALLARVPGELELVPGQEVWIEVAGAGRAWESHGNGGSRGPSGILQ
jgi:iron(III) transport system ATP-binding protein